MPKDMTAVQKKIEERKKEEIGKVEDRFTTLMTEEKNINER